MSKVNNPDINSMIIARDNLKIALDIFPLLLTLGIFPGTIHITSCHLLEIKHQLMLLLDSVHARVLLVYVLGSGTSNLTIYPQYYQVQQPVQAN